MNGYTVSIEVRYEESDGQLDVRGRTFRVVEGKVRADAIFRHMLKLMHGIRPERIKYKRRAEPQPEQRK